MRTFKPLLSLLVFVALFASVDGRRCSSTKVTAVDRKPWWFVDLTENSIVTHALISGNDATTDLSDSDSYLIAASTERDLEYNSVCRVNGSRVGEKENKYECKEPMTGRYVVIRRLNSCYNQRTCPLNYLPLSLCRVRLFGYRVLTDQLPKTTDVAFKSTVRQSTTIHPANLAVDGITRTVPDVQLVAQCSISRSWGLTHDWYVDLGAYYQIAKVEIYTNNSGSDLTVRAEIHHAVSRDTKYCHLTDQNGSGNKTTEKHEIGTVVMDCEKKVGRLVFIKSTADTLVLCEVRVYGYSVQEVNVAIDKPSKQSSIEHGGQSGLAVDGRKETFFYPYFGKWIAQCTHTSYEGDPYPWWRVDLIEEHLVSHLIVYNRAEGLSHRLHDVEIRIGNRDIARKGNGSFLFTENVVCAKFANKTLNGGENPIKCRQRLVGRYVSVQIVDKCRVPDCRPDALDRNILTLCEVQVYGDQVRREMPGHEIDLARGLSYENSFNRELKEEEDKDDHPWLMFNFQSTVIVDALSFNDTYFSSTGSYPLFEVRVGDVPITTFYNNRLFTDNSLCFRPNRHSFRHFGHMVDCLHPLVGRYLTVQIVEKCQTDECLINLRRIIWPVQLFVAGYHFHDVRTLGSLANFRPTKQSNTVLDGVSSLAVDDIVPISVFDNKSKEICAQTDDSKLYPWFQLELREKRVVRSVSVFLPGNNHNLRFHDVEIRVGDYNVAEPTRTDDEIVDYNALCAKTSDQIYPEGENVFDCQYPLSGKYVTVQITGVQFDKEKLSDRVNVLHMCELRAMAIDDPQIIDGDLSVNKNATQSSTQDEQVAQLAVLDESTSDERTVEEEVSRFLFVDDEENYYYKSCNDESPTINRCNVDTSQLHDCSQILQKGCTQSGVYSVSHFDNSGRRYFSVYCDMDYDGGGWTVMQRRGETSGKRVNFTRSWQQYEDGFGDLCGEFWLGNHYIHHFGGQLELRVLLIFGDKSLTANFETFYLDDESSNYTIHLSDYHGNAGDGWRTLNGRQFQTYDRNSAIETVTGGWWIGDDDQTLNLNQMISKRNNNNIVGVDDVLALLLNQSRMIFRPASFKSPSRLETEDHHLFRNV